MPPETSSVYSMPEPDAFGHGGSETSARLLVMAHLVTQPHTGLQPALPKLCSRGMCLTY